MGVLAARASFLLTGNQTASGLVGSALDARAATNYGYLYAATVGASAQVTMLGSHDATAWFPVVQVTAVPAGVTAQISAYLPYVAARMEQAFSGGGASGFPLIHYTPGIGG